MNGVDSWTLFREKNGLTEDSLQNAEVTWEELQEIRSDHLSRNREMQSVATYLLGELALLPKVHSVRMRVKDADHVILKILRKNPDRLANGKIKIDRSNYREALTDLIGLRLLHLYKADWSESIHQSLLNQLEVQECRAYYEKGDSTEIYSQNDVEHHEHEKGYRSVHYIIKCKPNRTQHLIELQVRTLFEEGWSEIDHDVRYPSFSKDTLVGDLLKIFSTQAGLADSLGAFVLSLQQAQDLYAKEMSAKEESLQAMLKELAKANDKEPKKKKDLERQIIELATKKFTISVDPSLITLLGSSSLQGTTALNSQIARLNTSVLNNLKRLPQPDQ